MSVFASLLRERLKAAGLTQSELARRIGVPQRTLGHYFVGRSEPNFAVLLRLCEALSCSPNDLLCPQGDQIVPRRLELVALQLDDASQDLAFDILSAILRRQLKSRSKPSAAH